MPESTIINTKNFIGAVLCKYWMHAPEGRQYIGFYGKVSILSDMDLVGFNVSGGESNWAARVAGETSSVNILGCQIRLVYEGHIAVPRVQDFFIVP